MDLDLGHCYLFRWWCRYSANHIFTEIHILLVHYRNAFRGIHWTGYLIGNRGYRQNKCLHNNHERCSRCNWNKSCDVAWVVAVVSAFLWFFLWFGFIYIHKQQFRFLLRRSTTVQTGGKEKRVRKSIAIPIIKSYIRIRSSSLALGFFGQRPCARRTRSNRPS